MRAFAAVLLVSLACSAYLRADAPKDARAVIDRAIQAAGGREKLEPFQSMTWKTTGTFYGMGQGMPYSGKYTVELPNKFRLEITDVFTQVVNGDKGWMKAGEEVQDMPKEMLDEMKESVYFTSATRLLSLDGKEFKLTLKDGAKVDDRPTQAVVVSHPGHRDITLYFDNDSGLLVKSESQVKSAEHEGKMVKAETWYKDYRDVQGAKLPGKMVVHRDGEQYIEQENQDQKPGKPPENTFTKP
jgi:hypothetical protein